MAKTKEKLQLPANHITVKIGINDYKIEFPNNDKLINIERYKQSLTGGTSQQMLQAGATGVQAYMLSEAIATFTILIPQLKDDLNVGSLLELNPLQSKNIRKAWEKYYLWMEEWMKVLNDDSEVKEETKDE